MFREAWPSPRSDRQRVERTSHGLTANRWVHMFREAWRIARDAAVWAPLRSASREDAAAVEAEAGARWDAVLERYSAALARVGCRNELGDEANTARSDRQHGTV